LDELEEEEKGVQFPELKRFSTANRFPLERFRVSKGIRTLLRELCKKPLIFCRRRQTLYIFLLAALEDYIDETRSNGFA
jgi:hypothetical protein